MLCYLQNKQYNRNLAYYQVVLVALTLIPFSMMDVWAEDTVPEFFTFTFENDLFVNNDDGYTNGTGITFARGPFKEFNNHNLPTWLHWLSRDLYVSTMKNKRRGVAHMFFQRMQTPEDLTVKEYIKNDIPYAGLLAWQGTLHAWDYDVSDQLSLYLGTVGPNAYAAETQNIMHKLTKSELPKGWDNQINNEIVFKVEAQRVWTLYRSESEGLQFDILGLAGAGIGNLESATKAGLAIRWGTHLKSSFATFSLQADRQVNPLALSVDNDFYLFFGVRGGVVFNDILINGNTFNGSHSAPLEPFQEQFSTGIVWSLSRTAFVFQISSLSSRTKLSRERKRFGAISITYRY